MTFASKLKTLNACESAVRWVGRRGIERAWTECDRGDWMLWLAGRVCEKDSDLHRLVVRAAVECARPALKHVPKGEKRPAEALRVALAWTKGKATSEQVRAAAAAASAAAAAASAAAASAADSAAAYAAYAAAAAAAAAASAADSVTASAAAAYADAAYADAADAAAAYAAARTRSLKRSANTVRRIIPAAEIQKALRRVT